MLGTTHPRKTTNSTDDLNRLLAAIETATQESNLLALNMALEGAHAGAGSAALLANAVGELSVRANRFSRRIRGCVRSLDSRSLSQVHRVTRGVADLIEEVSGMAGEVLDGIADPVVERRLLEVAPDLLDQVRSRAEALDLLLHEIPDAARGSRRGNRIAD